MGCTTTRSRRSRPLADGPRPCRRGIDRVEDPRDVYRVWLPRDGRLTATMTADANLDLGLWKQGAVSVLERIIGADRLARGIAPGTSERLTFANSGPRAVRVPRRVSAEGRPRGDLQPPGRPRRLEAPSRRRSTETAANSTGGSSTTSGFRTRTRTAVTGKSVDERVGDRGREGLEQVVGARVRDRLTRATTRR